MRKKVVIIYRHIVQYRVPFYELLLTRLRNEGIELVLIGGQGNTSNRAKNDLVKLPWAISSKDIYLFHETLVLQPCLRRALSADLVIVEQANKLLLNYALQILRPFVHTRLAFWGHGYCHQQPGNSLSNRFKSLITKNVDWWFAYTSSVAEYVVAQGFLRERITIVQNAIDTSTLSQLASRVSAEDIALVRKKYALTQGKTGVFCGGMYKEKQLPFLFQCAESLNKQDRAFSVIFIGSGLDAHFVEDAARKYPWIHYAGPQFGIEKVRLILAADFMLLPGAVGLGIIDSFVLERPLVTTDCPGHGPEIAYLDNNVNGIITPFTTEHYVNAVAELMRYPARLQELRGGCRGAGQRYTIEAMVENFADGVKICLQMEKP